jgi:hypothetical protein
MILLLIFLSGDTTFASGSLTGKWAVELPSLAVLNLGHTNPALAKGLNGCILNPAALSDVEASGFSTAVSLGSNTRVKQAPVLDMGEEIGMVQIPCDISVTQPVSLNALNVGISLKKWAFGFGFVQGMGTDISIDGELTLPYTFSDTIPDTLTHADISEIPQGQMIPVQWILSTPLVIPFTGSAGLTYSEDRFFVGVGRKSKRFKTGFGVTYKRIRGALHADLGASAYAPCTLSCGVVSGEWKVNASGNTTVSEDVFTADGDVSLAGDEFALTAGMILDLGLLKLGASITGIPETALHLSGGTTATWVSGIPRIVSIVPANINVDTTAKTITGEVDIGLSPFPHTVDEDNLREEYRLESRLAADVGGALNLGPFTGSAAIGLNTWGEFSVNLGFESRILIPLRSSLEFWYRAYQIDGEIISLIPYVVAGIGTSIGIRNVTLDLGVTTNSSIAAVSVFDSVQEEELPSLSELFSPVIGLSVDFK